MDLCIVNHSNSNCSNVQLFYVIYRLLCTVGKHHCSSSSTLLQFFLVVLVNAAAPARHITMKEFQQRPFCNTSSLGNWFHHISPGLAELNMVNRQTGTLWAYESTVERPMQCRNKKRDPRLGSPVPPVSGYMSQAGSCCCGCCCCWSCFAV